jgi:hypothetical protein
MRIIHYICPRQSGKTTTARNFQMNDHENTLLIETQGISNFNYIIDNLLRGKRFKKIIIDEFLFCTKEHYNPIAFKEALVNVKCEELFLYSTSDKLYNPIIFSLLYTAEVCVVKNTLHCYVNDEYREKFINEVDEINDKFLNPHDVIVIKDGKTNIPQSTMDHYEKTMRTKDFLLLKGEFLNLFINQ